MGHAQSHYPEDMSLPLGTYRIISGVAHTALEVSTFGHHKVEAWEVHSGDRQKWLLQPSGDGYRFQNLQHRSFLSVASTDMHARVYASRFPTTWVLRKRGDHYLIQYADANRVLDLHFGKANNGNKVTLQPGDELMCKTWKLVRLKDAGSGHNKTSEEYENETSQLKQQIDERDEVLAQYAKTTKKLRNKCNTKGHKSTEECDWITHKMTHLNLKATKFEYTRVQPRFDDEQDSDDEYEGEEDYATQEKHYEL